MSDTTELEKLRSEVDSLRLELSERKTARARRRRTIVSGTVAVLAVIATTLSLLGIWALRTLTNTDLFVERVGAVVEEPQVAEALGTLAADQLVTAVELQDRLQDRLPPELSVAAGPLTAAARNLLADGLTALAGTPQFQQAFDVALAASHRASIALLSGDDRTALSGADGTVTLNLTPIINALITEGSQFLSGALGRDIPAPSVTPETVDAALSAIEDRLGVDLPAEFGTITLVESAGLASAQQAYQVTRTSTTLAPVAALLLIGLAMALALHRVRALLSILVGTALTLLLVSLAFQPLKGSIIDSVPDQNLRGAVADSFEAVFSSLRQGVVLVTAIGVVAALALFLAGESGLARRSRALAGQAPSLAARHQNGFLLGGAVAALVLLAAIPGRGWGQIGVALLLYAAYALAVVLAPRPADEQVPDASPAPAADA